ncbi:MAG: heavy metal translocating P-type ATPase [Gammaproteobacteria bacterium]|nr:heavy metal translocating P-type ATPase [Gammaproteobacteria bacterium]
MSTSVSASQELSFNITGMTCGSCVERLEIAFTKEPGVLDVAVNLAAEKAYLSINPHLLAVKDLVGVVRRAGFDVGVDTRTYQVGGMSCTACAGRIQDVLLKVPGVETAEVNFATENATVRSIKGLVAERDLISRVRTAGFRLFTRAEPDDEAEQFQAEITKERRSVLLASFFSSLLVLQMVAQFIGWREFHWMPAAEVLFATPVQFWFGRKFYIGAFNALRNRSANMDVLVVLGTTSAYLYSWYLMIQHGEAAQGEMYFESAAVIITLVLWGKYLETRAKRKTFSAIRELLSLRPRVVRVRLESGETVEKPTELLELGEIITCIPGERISADGEVIEGEAHTDESLITGESNPVHRRIGDEVYEGAVNLDGHLVVRVTKVGNDTTLNRIARLVEQAQVGKTDIQRLVDKVSGYFVPVVILIALITLVAWSIFGNFENALINSVSVLVIACPCALGLATPTAVITGTGIAARAGILFRDIEALEHAHRVQEVVFDKTGTLTQGKPSFVRGQVVQSGSPELYDTYLRAAIALQSLSEHPIAKAFLDHAKEQGIDVLTPKGFRAYVGEGVSGSVDGIDCALGNHRLLRRFGHEPVPTDEYESTVWLHFAGEVVAEFVFVDVERPNSREAVAKLQQRNVDVHILSGDSKEVTENLARSLGITSYAYRQTPETKVARVEAIQKEGRSVAMVGDGINDAPALAQARLGIAMSSGTDIAMEVAAVTLMRTDPRLVAATLDISTRTFRKIRQNLFWAFIYNVVMIPLAVLGYLDPTIAGAAMALSSVSVVTNSLLLKRWHSQVS